MDSIVPQMYQDYGEYINFNRALPLSIDGLKLVERRLLLSTFKVAKDKLVKSAKIIGDTMGNYHPHGDTYSTIVNLVNRGFLIGQGQFGANIGVSPVSPAASRYTEVKTNPDMKKICFEYLKYVDWYINDLDSKEPCYFPTMIPLCFLGNTYPQGIAFGYSTLIPTYSSKDLYKRLMYLIGVTKIKPTIKPLSNCKILSNKVELEKILTTGAGKIDFQGIIKEDRKNFYVYLKSWPPGKSFDSLLSKNEEFSINHNIGILDLSNKNFGTNIRFDVLKARNREAIYNRFLKQLKEKLIGSVSFKINIVDMFTENSETKKVVKQLSVDEMLLKTFENYKRFSKVNLVTQVKELQSKIDEFLLLKKIRPYLSKILVDKTISSEFEEKIKILSQLSKIDINHVRNLLQNNTIDKLLKLKINIENLKDRIYHLNLNLNNFDTFIINEYTKIKHIFWLPE